MSDTAPITDQLAAWAQQVNDASHIKPDETPPPPVKAPPDGRKKKKRRGAKVR